MVASCTTAYTVYIMLTQESSKSIKNELHNLFCASLFNLIFTIAYEPKKPQLIYSFFLTIYLQQQLQTPISPVSPSLSFLHRVLERNTYSGGGDGALNLPAKPRSGRFEGADCPSLADPPLSSWAG